MSTSFYHLLILLIFIHVVRTSLNFDQGLRTGEICQWQTFTANCSSTEVILMETATYGRMKIGGCIKKDFNLLNCSLDVLKVVDWHCSGKQSCEIPVLQLSLLGFHPCTEDVTSYLEVSYKCVQVEQLNPFGPCKTPSLLFIQPSQSGYLALQTPPAHYYPHDSDLRLSSFLTDSKSCGWTLTALKGHRILLSILRFSDHKIFPNKTIKSHDHSSLAFVIRSEISKPEVCRHVAIVRDKTSGRETRACAEGDSRMENIFLSDGNSIDVIVTMTTTFGSRDRHLIKYQVTSCLIPTFTGSHVKPVSLTTVHVTCNSTGEKWTLTCMDTSWTGVVGSCPDPPGNSDDQSTASMWSTITNEWKSPKGLTLVICLGVLLGIAVGMMMLSFAICLIKQKPRCLSDGERPVDMELYEESGGPRFCPMMFASSTTTTPVPTNNQQMIDNSNTNLHDPNYWDHCLGPDNKCNYGQSAPSHNKNSFTPAWQHAPDTTTHPSYNAGSIMSSGISKPFKNPADVDGNRKTFSDELKMDGLCPDVVRGPSGGVHPGFQTILYADNPTSCWSAKLYQEKLPVLCATEDHHHHHHQLPAPPPLCSCSN